MNKIAKWLTDTANVLFDDTKNDLRALPKTVRLQLLIVLSGVYHRALVGITPCIHHPLIVISTCTCGHHHFALARSRSPMRSPSHAIALVFITTCGQHCLPFITVCGHHYLTAHYYELLAFRAMFGESPRAHRLP